MGQAYTENDKKSLEGIWKWLVHQDIILIIALRARPYKGPYRGPGKNGAQS